MLSGGCAHVGPSRAHVEPSCVHFGLMLCHDGPMLSHVGPILGLYWPRLGLCWAMLGSSWAHVGPILGLRWPMLGLSWPMLSHFGSPLLESMVAMLGISPNCLQLEYAVKELELMRNQIVAKLHSFRQDVALSFFSAMGLRADCDSNSSTRGRAPSRCQSLEWPTEVCPSLLVQILLY